MSCDRRDLPMSKSCKSVCTIPLAHLALCSFTGASLVRGALTRNREEATVSNVVSLHRSSEPDPTAAAATLPGPATAVAALRAQVSEQVRNAVRLLDLSVQRVRLMVMHVPDQQERRKLIHQMEAAEQRLQLARNISRRL